jgi:hypothetical protein
MEKPKIFIELYGGLVNRVVSNVDAEIYVLTGDSKANTLEDLETWSPVILVRNDEEFRHIANKIISKEI